MKKSLRPYFPHDANARFNRKIMALRAEYGNEGYAWFFMLLEMMRGEPDRRLSLKPTELMRITKELDMTLPKQASDFIDYCVELKLLTKQGEDYVYSEGLDRRMIPVDSRIKQSRTAAKKRWK